MINSITDPVSGHVFVTLREPIRDHEGKIRFNEKPELVKEINNLDRVMYLVRFLDGATTYLYKDEIEEN